MSHTVLYTDSKKYIIDEVTIGGVKRLTHVESNPWIRVWQRKSVESHMEITSLISDALKKKDKGFMEQCFRCGQFLTPGCRM